MTLPDILHSVIYPGLSLLTPQMNTPPAVAMLLSIGLQESRFAYRRQIGGPARGFYQFERGGGVKGVLSHHATQGLICAVLDRLEYDRSVDTSYVAIEHNDALATVYARLLLWTLPDTLPGPGEYEKAWGQYIDAWRPGRPHRDSFDDFYRQAWEVCGGYPST